MNKRIIMLSMLLGLTASTTAITSYKVKLQQNQSMSLAPNAQYYSTLETEVNSDNIAQEVTGSTQPQASVEESARPKETTATSNDGQAISSTTSTKNTLKAVPSRGGQLSKNNVKQNTITQSTQAKTPSKTSNTAATKTTVKSPSKTTASAATQSKVEVLDWWKSARSVFAIGTVAEITDVYTGKTFKAKRTMGTNHADTEALTKQDSEIIKSIWGGFSWARRPVVLNIKGKRLAASMSAMPHAGIDSAPAYSIVNNRSDGYGKGENLDVIKENGMDGHFDIHFLNSTRHKDDKIDSAHQAAIMKAVK